MGPLPYGPVTRHINTSSGPDYEQTNFYVTEYSLSHGKSNFQPRLGKHTGTGYKSNFRPGLYYSKRLDEIDNPVLGEALQQNYSSMNSFDFRSSVGSNGKDNLPNQLHMIQNAFVKDRPQTLPKNKQVKSACYDPQNGGFMKPPRSLLYLRCNKDPIETENHYHGPARMSTENQARFVGNPNKLMDVSDCSVGPKEGSGFTHAYNNEPITYRVNSNFDGNRAEHQRPIGTSIMKNSFQPTQNANGKEKCRLLSQRATDQNGYTRWIKARPEYTSHRSETYTQLEDIHPLRRKDTKKNDSGEYFNLLYADRFPSMTKATFQGLQKSPDDTDEKHRIVGGKEETGFTENNCKFVPSAETQESLKRFDTHYSLRFYNKNPKTSLPTRCVLPQNDNGFVKSTRVHSHHGKRKDPRPHLQTLDPYVARSMTARDPYVMS